MLVGACITLVKWSAAPHQQSAPVAPHSFRGSASTPRWQCHHSRVTPLRSRVIIVASHLREGADGALRLRIIDHNLRLLSAGGGHAAPRQTPLAVVVVFSYEGAESAARATVDAWRGAAGRGAAIEDVLFVNNDAVLVDAAKWAVALHRLLPALRRARARVVLLNDSFLLTRPVPELWNEACGGVCGLAWTAAAAEPTRHVQSYLRSLSACEAESYVRFYERSKGIVRNVHELIQLFEINLGWAEGGAVSAIYDYAGEHPDNDGAQQALIRQGYPAIKLKKFFLTDDPWLSEDAASRPSLPPSFSAGIYRKMNHDLNHLGVDERDNELEDHFVHFGKDEARVYSSRPLVVKEWLREALQGTEGRAVLGILEAYLAALNASLREALGES